MKNFLKKTAYKIINLLPSSAILMLHNITNNPVIKKQILLSQENFFLLVDSFDRWIPLKTAIDKPSKKGLALTFDDGFEDVYTVAYPYLSEKNVPFTVFVTVEKLNTEGYLSTEQLYEISQNELCTIGGHCYHHLPLAKLSEKEQEFELLASKEELEKIIKEPITYMAFPYGQYNKTTLKILKKTKAYQASCIVGRGFLNFVSGYSKYEKPRIAMDNEVFEKNFYQLKRKYH